MRHTIACLILLLHLAPALQAQADTAAWWHGKIRSLRYHPDGNDFVIINGNRRFTRALYGTHTAFRVEAGDLPEFALYMPGMGGNMQLGLLAGSQSKWIIHAQTIEARYRPGCMLYTIRDSLLGKGTLHLKVLAMADAEGVLIQARLEKVNRPVQLCWVYGGASGKKFSRDGDMGPDPESSFYLKPEYCTGNRYGIQNNFFQLQYGQDRGMLGVVPPAMQLHTVDAARQTSPAALLSSAASTAPAIAGTMQTANGQDYYFALQNPATKASLDYATLPAAFQEAEKARAALAGRVQVQTPDPYINTIGGALAVAGDAIWEEPSYLHGAVGWRMRLNGWRGPYTGDALGWHDRAKMHFKSYALSQVTSPASGPVVADTALHLARQLEKMGTSLFSSGYICRNPGGDLRPHHYDMNLVYIDALLWHFCWTGDTALARELWPVLQRHLDWEKRNFDADGDGLYDAYAAIWASDALQYSGGGVTHSSAYNYRANKLAARIAALVGADPAPYRQEAAHILQALNTKLWMPQQGWYAEFKDLLGRQSLHPAAALWTIYHAIDSDVPDAFQAYQCMRYIDTHIPHIPVRAKGLEEGYYTLSTSNWMPYNWSLNNVVLAEVLHTSLANWEAGRNEQAFTLWKSALLESMYLGGSPGNFQQLSFYDAARGESYRDFADPIGMAARSLVQGLFGILPDALNNSLTIRPGFPAAWAQASLHTPDIGFAYTRKGFTDSYLITPSLPKQLRLKLLLQARASTVAGITVNGHPANWKNIDSAVGRPVIEISSPPATRYLIKIVWKGDAPDTLPVQPLYATGAALTVQCPHAKLLQVFDPQQVLQQAKLQPNRLQAVAQGPAGDKTVFVQLQQGMLRWWQPLCMHLQPPVDIIAAATQAPNSLQFRLQNNTGAAMQGRVQVNSEAHAFTQQVLLPAMQSIAVTVPAGHVLPGSNSVVFTTGHDTCQKNLVNWDVVNKDPLIEKVHIGAYFNDKLTHIFQNQYRSPRPAVPTLQLPTQGTGEWTAPLHTVSIDDSGLRKAAGAANTITLPQGIPFETPADSNARNIAFTSQWDNYPPTLSIPLSGKASHAYLLMAGSTNPMQSRFNNGAVIVYYTDGSSDTLVLRNPETWWPIQEDYLDDGYAFALHAAKPVRIHLKTGGIIFPGSNADVFNGKAIDGGAATVLDMPLNPGKTLQQLQLQTWANDVVIGLMSLSLQRK